MEYKKRKQATKTFYNYNSNQKLIYNTIHIINTQNTQMLHGHTKNYYTTIVLWRFWIFSGTTQVSRYQKGKSKNQSGFTGERDSEWYQQMKYNSTTASSVNQYLPHW